MMSDESYDPHARMHESFPRADSGSQDYSSRGVADTVEDMRTNNAMNYSREMVGGLADIGNFKRHAGAFNGR